MSEYKLKPIDELFNIGDSIDYLYLNQLDTFNNHPFSVAEDEDMHKLIESVKVNGIISPVIVREKGTGRYEVISGHRRTHAAKAVGLEKIPAIVKTMSDDEAVIAMVDANLQRENIKPSEKARAYKMKMEAIKHQGITCGQLVHKSRDTVSDTESGRQVQRYIRLTYLIPELLHLVDEEKIKLIPAVSISYLSDAAQYNLYEALEIHGKHNITIAKADKLRKAYENAKADNREIDVDAFLEILSPSNREEETVFKIELCLKLPMDYVGIINASELEELCNNYITQKTAKEAI